MGLLTALRIRCPYVVTVHGVANFPRESFRSLSDARIYADYIASTTRGANCFIYRDSDEVVYQVHWNDGRLGPPPPPSSEDDGSSGVREPRRPVPGSSAGAVALDFPDAV
jgi:hypothetical protein